VFTRNTPINEVLALRALVAQAGLDVEQAELAWNHPHWKDYLRAENHAAIGAGVFGAPFFIVDGEPFWGNDRKAQLERWLAQGAF
jgi:2-hydroxychromene-2-carboxylate isomerase